MTWIKNLFRASGIYGLVVLAPQYFMEQSIGSDTPPPITHPEYFYGFIGVAVAWQIAFLVIATDPRRYRPLMPVAALEKFSFAVAVAVLFAAGRAPAALSAFATIDFILGVLFVIAFIRLCGMSKQ